MNRRALDVVAALVAAPFGLGGGWLLAATTDHEPASPVAYVSPAPWTAPPTTMPPPPTRAVPTVPPAPLVVVQLGTVTVTAPPARSTSSAVPTTTPAPSPSTTPEPTPSKTPDEDAPGGLSVDLDLAQ